MRQPFVLLFATFALAGTTGRSEPTASFGTVYEPRQTKIEIVIKRSAFDQLPLDLPVYTTQDTNAFTRISIDWLLELLPLPGPERARAMQILSDHPSVVSKGRTMLSSAPNVTCVINPDESLFLCRYQNPGPAPTTATKPGNGLLGLEVFRLMLTNLFAKAEWKIGDVERRENDFRMQIADRQRYPNHQKEPVTVERTVTFFRHINDYPIIAATTFEIRLSRLANGDWSEVFIHWPQIKELGREKNFLSVCCIGERSAS